VKVVVRIRPLSRKELQDGHKACTEANMSNGQITVRNPRADEREPPKTFTFDAVFSPEATQAKVYEACAAPVVEAVLDGFNGTVFAYGQTGAGKSHTMEGYPDPPELRGIIPNSFEHIFDKVALAGDDQQWLVRASYLEIYNEEIRDLLSKDPKNHLELKENVDTGVYVKDLTSFVVKTRAEIDQVMQAGKKNRSVGATLMNQTSSRSHSIFTIVVEASTSDERGDHIHVGKLNLVDLAGSERQSKTGATGDRLKEATKINLSLSALGNVISALVDGRSQHIPYRDSKLTRLLQDSLGGNTKTVMCANCGPAEYNYDETVTTLRYANRAKNIKNKPKINEDPKDAMLREFQEEIKRLKAQLEAAASGAPPPTITVDGKEVAVPVGSQVIEKIVEKEVLVEVNKGASEEQLKELEAKANAEKERLKRKAKEEMKKLLDDHSKTDEERKALQDRLEKEAEARQKMENQKQQLVQKMKQMQQKLIHGGEMMDKAAKQEAALRRAKLELEKRQEQEEELAKELAEKEEERLRLDEQYSSLQDEVEDKTNKLKKLWTKYQTATREIQDIQEEFQTEREDMLDTIRQLSRQLKLKELLINNFIPEDEARKLERRAQWDDDNDTWFIPKLDIAGNQIRPRRPVSANGLRRPETEYSRQRKQFDANPRYKHENIIGLELDMPERTTQDYEGPGMVSRVQPALGMSLDAEDEDVQFSVDNGIPSPYLQYTPEDAIHNDGTDRTSSRPKTGMKKSKSRPKTGRPSTASRRRRQSAAPEDAEVEFTKEPKVQYPKARGLVGDR